MAREFGDYSPVVAPNVTWEESIQLLDEDGVEVDLTGYKVRAQLYLTKPTRVAGTGLAVVAPTMEITSAAYYTVLPAWPVVVGFTTPVPANGTIVLSVPVASVWLLNPTNARRAAYYWDIVLVNASGYAIPVVKGRVVIGQAHTL